MPPERRDPDPTSGLDRHGPGGLTAPQRELRDPRELRALAHPVRLAILQQLLTHGPSTATELAERLQEESPANCSWHLRQLARYGFIEEAESGPGRQRRWRIIPQQTTISPAVEDSPELIRAADAADEIFLDWEVAALRRWRSVRLHEPVEWRDGSFTMHNHGWLTASEMAAFQADLAEVFARHPISSPDRLDAADRPADARPVRLVAWLIPYEPTSPGAGTGTTSDDKRTTENE
jgi:DNA-binding transcriptional ArsR family regulator